MQHGIAWQDLRIYPTNRRIQWINIITGVAVHLPMGVWSLYIATLPTFHLNHSTCVKCSTSRPLITHNMLSFVSAGDLVILQDWYTTDSVVGIQYHMPHTSLPCPVCIYQVLWPSNTHLKAMPSTLFPPYTHPFYVDRRYHTHCCL